MVPHMDKTTLYLDSDVHRQLKLLARQRGRPVAELVREAVAEYAARHAGRAVPASLGMGRSGRGDLGERAEELLRGMGEAP